MAAIVGPPGAPGASIAALPPGTQMVAFNVGGPIGLSDEAPGPRWLARSALTSAPTNAFGTAAFALPRDGLLTQLDATVDVASLTPAGAFIEIAVWLTPTPTGAPAISPWATLLYNSAGTTHQLITPAVEGDEPTPLPAGTRLSLSLTLLPNGTQNAAATVNSVSASIRV